MNVVTFGMFLLMILACLYMGYPWFAALFCILLFLALAR